MRSCYLTSSRRRSRSARAADRPSSRQARPGSSPNPADASRSPIRVIIAQITDLHVRPRGWKADRKSTRLNSSHTVISYAVFCLEKKKHTSELQSHSDLVCRLLLDKKTGPRRCTRSRETRYEGSWPAPNRCNTRTRVAKLKPVLS